MQLVNMIKQFARDEEGVVAIEYGLMAAVVATGVVILGTNILQPGLQDVFNTLLTDIKTIADGVAP